MSQGGRAGRASLPKASRGGRRQPKKRFDRAGDVHHNANGRPKVTHLSQEAAEARAADMTQRTGQPTRAYECPDCGGWHTGRKADEQGK